MTEIYEKQFHASKDKHNDAASKLSADAEDSLKEARDPKATATSYSHAIIKGETHPLGDTKVAKENEEKAKKEEEAAKAKEKKDEEKVPKLSKEDKAKGEGKEEKKEGAKEEEKKEEGAKEEEKKDAPPAAEEALKIKASKSTQSTTQNGA